MNFRLIFKNLAICIAFIGMSYYCSAQSVVPDNRFIETVIPTEWQKVASEQYSEILNMLIKSFENNYEKIKTVQGEYNVNYEQTINLSELVKSSVNIKSSNDTLQKQNFSFRFACDNKTKKVFREKLIADTVIIDSSTREILKLDNISPVEMSSIATPNDFIFSRHKTEPYIAELLDFPTAMNTRVARRISSEMAARNLVDNIDPMEYFDLKKWGNTKAYLDAILGKEGDEEKNKVFSVFSLYKTSDVPPWFLAAIVIPQNSSTEMIFKTYWCPGKVFLPVHHSVIQKRNNNTELTRGLTQIEWLRYDTIFFPKKASSTTYYDTGKLSYRRDMTTNNLLVNEVLAKDQFNFSALGLENGDLLLDEIKQTVFTIQNNKPVYLAKFYEKYQTPRERSFNRVRMFIMLLGFALIVLGIYLKIRRRRIENKK
jgi:hypothetical protein